MSRSLNKSLIVWIDITVRNRSSKKRPFSSSRNSNSGLEPVAEENSWLNVDPNFKLSRLPEDGQTPEQGRCPIDIEDKMHRHVILSIYFREARQVERASSFAKRSFYWVSPAELLVETGPTQTQRPISSPPVDKLTDTIRTYVAKSS